MLEKVVESPVRSVKLATTSGKSTSGGGKGSRSASSGSESLEDSISHDGSSSNQEHSTGLSKEKTFSPVKQDRTVRMGKRGDESSTKKITTAKTIEATD